MIAFVEGILEDKQPTRVVLNANGIGYAILIPLSSYEKLPQAGEKTRLLTHFHVREDAQELFGFFTDGERELFGRLLSVSGIGPKLALSALSGMSVRELTVSIVQGDVKRLTGIPGVGKKVAERMVVELKDQLSKGEGLQALADEKSPQFADQRLRDAMLALVSLGYKAPDAEKLVMKIAPSLGEKDPVEEVVRCALKG